MDWLLVATAIRLVTAVGSVDIQEKKNIYMCIQLKFVCV